jgi:hypothetical protein
LAAQVRAVVEPGLSLLIPYLQCGSEETVMTVAEAFGCFPHRANEFLPSIENALMSGHDEEAADALAACAMKLRSAMAAETSAGSSAESNDI